MEYVALPLDETANDPVVRPAPDAFNGATAKPIASNNNSRPDILEHMASTFFSLPAVCMVVTDLSACTSSLSILAGRGSELATRALITRCETLSRPTGTSRRRGTLNRDHRILITVDRKSTRLNSSHLVISYAVFC